MGNSHWDFISKTPRKDIIWREVMLHQFPDAYQFPLTVDTSSDDGFERLVKNSVLSFIIIRPGFNCAISCVTGSIFRAGKQWSLLGVLQRLNHKLRAITNPLFSQSRDSAEVCDVVKSDGQKTADN